MLVECFFIYFIILIYYKIIKCYVCLLYLSNAGDESEQKNKEDEPPDCWEVHNDDSDMELVGGRKISQWV